jgi:hypothetical protein
MVSVGSFPVQGEMVFDLETQAGITQLLVSIRASELSSIQKSELRDLVFLYTNGGKDQSVRLSLEQKLSQHHITPVQKKVDASVATSQESVTQPPRQIGKFRAAPSFAVHKVPVTPAPIVASEPIEREAPVAEPVVEAVPIPPPPPEAPVIPVFVEPEPVSVLPEIPVAPQSTPEEVDVMPIPPVIRPLDEGQYLDRIREIKAAVNEKVGNPVNLVDIDNAVGREYMAALLDAMKKINTGSSAGSAMTRLEAAYASVLQAIEHHNNPEASHAAPAEPEVHEMSMPAATPLMYEEESEPEIIDAAPAAPLISYPEFSEESPSPMPAYQEFAQPAPPPFEPVQEEQYSATPHVEEEASSFGAVSVQSHHVQNEGVSGWDAAQSVPISEPTHPHAAAAFAPLSQAKEKPLSIDDLPTTPTTRPEVSADGILYEKEVDDGLQQLLQEWSIFKKSGLFGTGPKGREHPLFKKMAPLHIPLLLAGRFEGATQEIKQSVTDYMNGWRYEQGLIYQQGETFEHYLRRVIRHIIDLQKG